MGKREALQGRVVRKRGGNGEGSEGVGYTVRRVAQKLSPCCPCYTVLQMLA